MKSRILQHCFTTIITLGLLISTANAQTETDWNTGSGEFLEPDNWTNGVPDFAIGVARFVVDASYEVNLETEYNSSAPFMFVEGWVTLVGGGDLRTQGVDQRNEGLLTITDGTTMRSGQYRLYNQTALFIEDDSSMINNGNFSLIDDAELHVDDSTLQIAGGSLALFTDSVAVFDGGSMVTSNWGRVGSGVSSIDGALNSTTTLRVRSSSVWDGGNFIEVGTINSNFASSDDLMTIQSGGLVTTPELSIGKYIASGGSVSPTGAMNLHGEVNVNNGTLDIGDLLIVGEDGNGTLVITNGGQVTSENVTIGDGEFSTGVVNINNTGLLTATDLIVGEEGVGNLNVMATANATNCFIGNGAGDGTVTVDSATFTVGSLNIGEASGDGTLRLINNAFANFGNSPNIGPNGTLEIENSQFLHISANGTLTVEGFLRTSGAMATIEDETILLPTASVETAAGTTFFDTLRHSGDEFCIPPGADVVVREEFTGTSTFSGTGGVEFRGIASPGSDSQTTASTSARHLTFDTGSTAQIDIFSTNPVNGNDRFVGLESITIQPGATLDVTINPNLTIQLGQQFEILRINSSTPISGFFVGTEEGSVVASSNGFDLEMSYIGGDGNDIVLCAVQGNTLLGDVNLDGVVNLLDVAPFVDRISSGVFQVEADCNEDGAVNLLDVSFFISLISG